MTHQRSISWQTPRNPLWKAMIADISQCHYRSLYKTVQLSINQKALQGALRSKHCSLVSISPRITNIIRMPLVLLSVAVIMP